MSVPRASPPYFALGPDEDASLLGTPPARRAKPNLGKTTLSEVRISRYSSLSTARQCVAPRSVDISLLDGLKADLKCIWVKDSNLRFLVRQQCAPKDSHLSGFAVWPMNCKRCAIHVSIDFHQLRWATDLGVRCETDHVAKHLERFHIESTSLFLSFRVEEVEESLFRFRNMVAYNGEQPISVNAIPCCRWAKREF